jgi:1-pyrroline-5-carboxylate dehydrogenase
MNQFVGIPTPLNEPVFDYAPGSKERPKLQLELQRQLDIIADVPMLFGENEYRGTPVPVVAPHQHSRQIGCVHQADTPHIQLAVEAARRAAHDWNRWTFEERAAVFLKAADLLAGPWRQRINAATMLGQSKTAYQAEIDSACELIDFLRFNVAFASKLYAEQPQSSAGCWNRLDYRPLEGFVYAVTPFNFTAIAGNLATAPALMGNCVIWKPSNTASISNYVFMQVLLEAGLPPGVINFIPGNPELVSRELLADPHLSGIHFTGSTRVLNQLWSQVSANLGGYRDYPRIVGETGGKGFVLAHKSADITRLATALVRGAFEYQGQKCSAASRAYVPRSVWRLLKPMLFNMVSELKMGPVTDFGNFMGAVIDQRAFERVSSHIDAAVDSGIASVLVGGTSDKSEGYYVSPTVLEVTDPRAPCMREEIFGPVLSVFVYDDADWTRTLELLDAGSAYGLTGAVFARDRKAVKEAADVLRYAAGNFYINDKPTGAVVGQQPFGGARGSGTNDKAGSPLNLLRWVSPRTIKETFSAPTHFAYPSMLAS